MKKHLRRASAKFVNGTVLLSWFLDIEAIKGDELRSFRIYGRDEPDFTFNQDYGEFFDGLLPTANDLLYEGPISPVYGSKFNWSENFTDECYGRTRVYWVALADYPATGPAPVRLRDPNVWWSAERIQNELESLSNEHPTAVMETVGFTVNHLPIHSFRVGVAKPCIALIGALHPGESGPELIIPALRNIIRKHPKLLESVGIAVLPSLVADQRERMVKGNPWYLRRNAAEVDINRNFPADWEEVAEGYGLRSDDPQAETFRGMKPASEPETQVVMNWLGEVQPSAVWVYHALAGITGALGLMYGGAENDQPFAAHGRKLMDCYATGFNRDSDYEPIQTIAFSATPGSLGAWCYSHLGIQSFDLEWDYNPDALIAHSDGTTMDLLSVYQKRHYGAILAVLQQFAQNTPKNR